MWTTVDQAVEVVQDLFHLESATQAFRIQDGSLHLKHVMIEHMYFRGVDERTMGKLVFANATLLGWLFPNGTDYSSDNGLSLAADPRVTSILAWVRKIQDPMYRSKLDCAELNVRGIRVIVGPDN